MTNPILSHQKSQAGLSLIELMVAAIVLGVAITGIMSMIGTGRQFEYEGEVRRQAGTIVARELEDTLYHYSKFDMMAPRVRNTSLFPPGASPIAAVLTVELAAGQSNWTGITGNSLAVPFQHVRAKLTWPMSGKVDSVVLTKRVAKVLP